MNNKKVNIDADLDYLLEYIPNPAARLACQKRVDAIRAAFDMRASSAPAKPSTNVTLAVIGCKHFGNPIPREWYAAAHDLLADVGVSPSREEAPAAQAVEACGMRPLSAGLPSPDDYDRVLVYTDGVDFNGDQYFDINTEDLWEPDPDMRTEVADAATHWMPLPRPGTTATPSSVSSAPATRADAYRKVLAMPEGPGVVGPSSASPTATPSSAAPALPVELMGVREEMAAGSGFWSSCSGCYDTEDGHPTGTYSYSHVFGCALGSGCSECGGLGAVWDDTDYEAMARDWDKDDTAAPAASVAPAGLTASQIAAGAAVLDDDGKPVGRNVAIMVADAMQVAPAEDAKDAAPGHREDYYLMANARRVAEKPIYAIRSMPNWVFASELFATGSTAAYQICRDAGIDPDGYKIDRAALASTQHSAKAGGGK